MNKIEVFRTNVTHPWQAKIVSEKLQASIPGLSAHFDLEDHEKILRVEANSFEISDIILLLHDSGFNCEVLED